MFLDSRRIRFGAVLLGMIFLAAQFHYCADLNAGPAGSHPCQLCSTAGSAIAPPTLNLAIVPVVNCIEVFVAVLSPSVELPRITSPRAPPAL
ncbi:MAG: hypothetical protein ACRD51_14580 [Candidatus Acidiferrum sp.]